jgi:hypothetical protein
MQVARTHTATIRTPAGRLDPPDGAVADGVAVEGAAMDVAAVDGGMRPALRRVLAMGL